MFETHELITWYLHGCIYMEHEISNKSHLLPAESHNTIVHYLTPRNYRNDPKFSDGLVWANSADPDQTAPRGAV